MKALVLAAGKGSRLGSVSGGTPKPLVEVGGTTPLEHALTWIVTQKPTCIWINVHQHAAMVQDRVGTSVQGVPIRYSHESELLGTAGAWKKLESEWEETSLVVYGDNFMRFDLAALRATHARTGALATIALFDPDRHAHTAGSGGRAILDGDRAIAFAEGGAQGFVNAGACVIEPGLSSRLPAGFLDFGHDVLPDLARQGELAGHVVEDGAFCLGIDDPSRLAAARELARELEVSR